MFLKSIHRFRRRRPLSKLLTECLKVFSIVSSGDHFVQGSGMILAILVQGYMRNISDKLF